MKENIIALLNSTNNEDVILGIKLMSKELWEEISEPMSEAWSYSRRYKTLTIRTTFPVVIHERSVWELSANYIHSIREKEIEGYLSWVTVKKHIIYNDNSL